MATEKDPNAPPEALAPVIIIKKIIDDGHVVRTAVLGKLRWPT